MHQLLGAHNLTSVNLPDGLVPQTHSEDWQLATKGRNDLAGNPRLIRRARTRRNTDPRGLEIAKFFHRHGIIPQHFHLRSQLAKILDEIVGKGIVVIDND